MQIWCDFDQNQCKSINCFAVLSNFAHVGPVLLGTHFVKCIPSLGIVAGSIDGLHIVLSLRGDTLRKTWSENVQC